MKFGIRDCADVVLRAKSAQKIGNKIFYKNEPVCYFDTLRTSTFEGAATTVYAQGGRGNARLMSWDGERTVTFTMEDALISPIGLSILTGAGLIEASTGAPITQHILEINPKKASTTGGMVLFLENDPRIKKDGHTGTAATDYVEEPTIYVMITDDHGEIISEPYLFKTATTDDVAANSNLSGLTVANGKVTTSDSPYKDLYPIVLAKDQNFKYNQGVATIEYADTSVDSDGLNEGGGATDINGNNISYKMNNLELFKAEYFAVDYYTQKTSGAMQIDITPDKFGGTYYLEASTLWRDQGTGKDLPAEFIIPACKIQSNFSFTLSSTGDPSSFTFTMDAFPDYTRFDKTEKVLARIQVLGMDNTGVEEVYRSETWSKYDEDSQGLITGKKST